eukprot:3938995-Rhodomonas_salina.1
MGLVELILAGAGVFVGLLLACVGVNWYMRRGGGGGKLGSTSGVFAGVGVPGRGRGGARGVLQGGGGWM